MPAFSIPWNAVLATGIVVAVLLSVLYILQVNQLTKNYYLTTLYQKQIKTLAEKNRTLQVSFNENNFVSKLTTRARAMDLSPSTSVQYVRVLDNAFALAK